MKIGVYGLGRFGRLWASLLAERHSVLVCNRTPRQAPPNTTLVPLAELGDCDAVFLCVAISSMEEVVASVSTVLPPSVLLMDTCSVKLHPMHVFESTTPDRRYLLTHPMFGPDSARSGVQGLPMIVCPGSASVSVYRRWIEEFRAYGLRVIEMSAEEHDREAAFTQGITHFIGRVLADLDIRESAIGTLGYHKLLEVMEQTCNDPYQLFVDLQRYNPYTSQMRAELQESLRRIMGSLEANLDSSIDGR